MNELFDELAAKYEYSANMPRPAAEARARRELEEPEQVELFTDAKDPKVVDYFAEIRKKFKEIDKEKGK